MASAIMLPINNERMIGLRYGNLVVISISSKRIDKHVYFNCKCDCGKLKIIAKSSLRHPSRAVKSCGCKMRIYKTKYRDYDRI